MLRIELKNKTGFILVLFLCSMFLLTGCSSQKKSYIEKKTENGVQKSAISKSRKAKSKSNVSDSSFIYVDVEGAIESPGVYKVKKDSRVFEVLKLSGGVKQDAYLGDLNQASVLFDGQKIYIPTQSEMEKALNVNSGDFSESGDDVINLNRATKEDLMKLPGIGEAKADSIIKYREKNGLFKNVKDITKIAGIKQGVYQKIKKLIKVD